MGLFIETLTWREMEDALPAHPTLLVPIGAGCKEHGLHLPLNTDLLSANYFARRIADVATVLVAPALCYGYYPAFTAYPGSASIGEEAFAQTVVDICRSFARHGMRRFYVLNTGISTIPPLGRARASLACDNLLMVYSDLRKLAVAERKAIEQQPYGTHADEVETSVMLHIAPDVVRMDRAQPDLSRDAPGPLTRDRSGPGLYSPTGAWGDPTLATAEKGKIIVDAIVRDLLAAIEEMR